MSRKGTTDKMPYEAKFVYALAYYNEDHGFNGVNTFKVYDSIERAAFEIDDHHRQTGFIGVYKDLEPVDLEPIKKKLTTSNVAFYRNAYHEDETWAWVIVRLQMF